MDDVRCEMEFLTPCIKTQIDLQFLPPKPDGSEHEVQRSKVYSGDRRNRLTLKLLYR